MEDRLDVRGMREQIHGLDVDGPETPLLEDGQVPGEGPRVTGHIDKVGGLEPGNRRQDSRIAP